MIGAELRRHSEQVIPEGANSGKRAVLGIDDLVSAAACGARFRNLEGREYVDYLAAFGPQVLGHCNPDVDRTFQAAVARVDLPGVAVAEREIEVAERIAGHVPSILKVLLTSMASEATFHARRRAEWSLDSAEIPRGRVERT